MAINMSGIKAGLTKKVGPLPAWGWGVVAGVSYVLYKKFGGTGLGSSETTTENAIGEYSGPVEASGAGYGYNAPPTINVTLPEAAKPAKGVSKKKYDYVVGRRDYWRNRFEALKAARSASRSGSTYPKSRRKSTPSPVVRRPSTTHRAVRPPSIPPTGFKKRRESTARRSS